MSGENVIQPDELEYYFRLLWLLVVFIIILMVSFIFMYIAMRKSREKESQSMKFSSYILEGQETKRQRIAAELHDTVLSELRGNPVSARIREICGSLMPPDFNRYSLKDSLVSLCDTFIKRSGIECIIEIADDVDFGFLNMEQRLHLYRIVQESLNNIEKHSHAKCAVLIVRRKEPQKSIIVSISDDGDGLPPRGKSRVSARKFGLTTMRQRAALLGAEIEFLSEEGNGLMVCVEIPQEGGQ